MDFLAWLEQTRISTFVREDFYAYFVLLVVHAWGMAFLVGGGLAVSLRVIGVGKQIALDKVCKLFPLMKVGAMLAIISGIGLLLGYPAKALTNWVFLLKFICLIAAFLLLRHIARISFGKTMEPVVLMKLQAILAIMLWLAGVASGKLLLYTNSMLMTTDMEW